MRVFNDLPREAKLLNTRERSVSRGGSRAPASLVPVPTASVGCQTSGPHTVEVSDLASWQSGGESFEALRPLLDREWSDEALSDISVAPGTVLSCSSEAIACFAAANLESGGSPADELICRMQSKSELLGDICESCNQGSSPQVLNYL